MANIGSIDPVTKARAPETLDGAGFLGSLELYVSDAIGIITTLATLFFIVYAFLAAFQWTTAGGDSGKIEKAKNRFIWGTLGLILIVASYAIIGLVGSLIGISILNPAELIQTLVPGVGTTP
jgi:hypothetical protein